MYIHRVMPFYVMYMYDVTMPTVELEIHVTLDWTF